MIKRTSGRARFVRAFVVPCVLAGVGSAPFLPPLQQTASQSAADRVTYTTFRPSNWNLYLFTQPGEPPEQLTTGAGLHYDPVLSPDGRWLVYCSEQDGDPGLYVVDLRRRGTPRLLIEGEGLEDQAAFSPDGRSIAFVSSASGNADIYIAPFRPERPLRISDAKNLTQHAGGDFRPAFSPDGRSLAFSSNRDSPVNDARPIGRVRDGDIYLLDLTSGVTRRLTDAPGWDGSPSWSPDCGTIVFYSQRDTRSAGRVKGINDGWSRPEARIWATKPDGSNQRLLTPDESLALSPEYLPNGRIVYSRKTRGGVWQIASVNRDGSDVRLESDSSTHSYWEPTRGPTAGSIIVHGSTSPGVPLGQVVSPASMFRDGVFLAPGAPFRRNLSDRTIELYPVRQQVALLHPQRDVLLVRAPFVAELQFFRLNGTRLPSVPLPGEMELVSTSASWSRDGEWIVFGRGRSQPGAGPAQEADVWKIRSDGTGLQNLTPDSPGNDAEPTISRDGNLVAYRHGGGGRFDLYLVDAGGGEPRSLLSDSANHAFPVFSPTADLLAFLSETDGPSANVYDIFLLDLDPDGRPGRIRRVTRNEVQEGHPAFSPDGQWLIYSSEMGGTNDEEPLVQSVAFGGQCYGDMYAYRIADGTTVRLTHNKWEEGVPSWEARVTR